MTQKSNRFYGQTVLILTGVFLFMLVLNILLPIRGDDFDYSLIWGTTQHVQSFGNVCQSMWNHYMTHGGRMVTVFVLDLFLWLGKRPFDIANAAVFTGLVVLLYCHGTRDTKLTAEPGILAASALLLWICLPHFGEVAVWKSGSTVYLWSGFFAALFLLPYNLFLAGRIHWGAGMALPMFLLGVLGGWSVENLAVTVVMLACGICWYAWKKKMLQSWLPAGAAGAVLGAVGLIGAPGNFARYGEQGTGKGILSHIGNQFAGNGDMLLFILPAVLLLFLVWRILKASLLDDKETASQGTVQRFSPGEIVTVGLIFLFALSYFAEGFLGNGIRDLIISGVLEPLDKAKPKTIYQITHVMEGFEEMAVFWAGIFFIYFRAKKSLGLDKRFLRRVNQAVRARDVWAAFPEVRFAGAMIILCLFNNFVMIAAPTFPGRATFSSAFLFFIAVIAVLRMAPVQEALRGPAGRILKVGSGAVGLFIAVAAVWISYTVTVENDARIAYIESRQGSGEVIVVPPIGRENRALRHVFYKEFREEKPLDSGSGVARYYGVKEIRSDRRAVLPPEFAIK